MSRLAIGSALSALLGSIGVAHGADIYTIPPTSDYSPVYSPAPAFSWTGPYIGIQAGYDWNRYTSPILSPPERDVNGGILGLYGGYNWQHAGNWVVGIDGSVNWDFAEHVDGNDTWEANWKGLIRGRLGFAFDRFLVYGTAGAAVMGFTLIDGSDTASATPWGWTIGGGVEMAVTDHVVARVDYSYQDYGTFTSTGDFTATSSVSGHAVMGGVALKF